MAATDSVNTEIKVNTDHFSWVTVADGISAGSWAVVLFLGVVFVMVRKPLGSYFAKQLEVLDKVKETLEVNATTLEKMAETDQKTAEAVTDMQKQAFMLTGSLDRFHSEHQTIITKLDNVLDKLK